MLNKLLLITDNNLHEPVEIPKLQGNVNYYLEARKSISYWSINFKVEHVLLFFQCSTCHAS